MGEREMIERVAKAICSEQCAFMGEPPCWQAGGLSPDCDEPGCLALAEAAIAAMISAAPAAPNGWQPFPSCPEDGTEFQAWVIGSNGHGSWEPRCRINPETGAFEIWGRVDYDQDDWATYSHIAPTHWQPLPAAPTEGSD